MRFAQHALLSVEGLIDKMTNIYPLNSRFIPPFVFVLALSLLFLLPGGLAQAQTAEQFFTYPENGTSPVATFTASDPEGASPIVWSLTTTEPAAADAGVTAPDFVDNALFDISQGGVLTFVSPPDYEMPIGGDDDSNTYRVVVQASDGSNVDYFEVYVNVTNVEETGKVTWAVDPDGDGGTTIPTGVVLRQFQPGAVLTPEVTDPDAVAGTIADADVTTWQWYRSSSRSAAGTAIAGPLGTEATYAVTDGDVGMHIRVVATYSDGNGPEETVNFASETPVQAFRLLSNAAPAFASPTAIRRIAENSTGNVGGPITATDSNNDTLTYAITDGADQGSFRIDAASGQLMVGPTLMIDYEDEDGNDSYAVVVTAYDSSGTATVVPIVVTINVFDVDEKPMFTEEIEGMAVPHTEGMTVIDADPDVNDVQPATYTATDQDDGDSVTLSLMGDDAGLFELNDPADVAPGSKVLAFKKNPDFETPGDRNQDNVYEVTVRASDGTLHADRMVVVKVTNVDEPGKVTISPENAVVGVELTATLTNSEGRVSASGQISDESWMWQSTDTAPSDGDCSADSDVTYQEPEANTNTYTPSDAVCVRATVTYTYQSVPMTTAMSDGVLVQESRTNQAPKFSEGASTFRVVAESVAAVSTDDTNNEPGDDIGSPIEASDANSGDTPAYTLSGSDASRFRVRANGQLEVNGSLDHETKASHTVRLTANDGSGGSNATASITVIIYVTDVDEEPTIKDRANPSAKGQEGTVEYRENGTGPVASFTASDPEGAAPIAWSLTTTPPGAEAGVEDADFADNGLFDINQGGVLTFMSPPNFEGMSVTGDDNYQVVVQASDGNEVGYFKVTVDVTDVEEAGEVTWTVNPAGTDDNVPAVVELRQFQPGAVLTASVTDPDDTDLTGTMWKWDRSSTEIIGESENTYTVTDRDVGMRIRVTATYSDSDGSGPADSKSLTSKSPVQAARQSNDDPAFASTIVTRRIAENSTGNIGGPITATDSNNDTLTYAITAGDGAALFDINPATGQLMVGSGIEIDYDALETPSYMVVVTAYDSAGADTNPAAMVTIHVIDVDEKPTFDTATDVVNVTRDIIEENATTTALDIATYTATDPEEENVTLSLMGDDAGLFELAADTAVAGEQANNVSQVLSFKKSPDFEMPGDRNTDNLYEVTVRASDGTLNADLMVVVKVTDAETNEDGKVTLSSKDALVGVELTATPTDLEDAVSASGQITNQKWTWHLGATATFTPDIQDNSNTDIESATSSTYTPVATDAGMYLRAVVSYTYQFGATKMGTSDAVRVQAIRENQAPKFKDGASTFRVVAENAPVGAAADAADVGSPVEATDANGDTVTYILGGSDKDLFEMNTAADADAGQIKVKAGAKLDHETKPRLMVTLTANDGSGESNATATITVTIYVSDVDEDPTIMASGVTIDLSISGATDTVYPETRTWTPMR